MIASRRGRTMDAVAADNDVEGQPPPATFQFNTLSLPVTGFNELCNQTISATQDGEVRHGGLLRRHKRRWTDG